MNSGEFGIFIDEIKQNLKEVENGSQVFNGMMHKNRVTSLLKHITRTLEVHLETDTKQYVELEVKAAELDRREQGVEVMEFDEPSWYIGCGKCEAEVTGKYCSECGTKLIWPNSEVER